MYESFFGFRERPFAAAPIAARYYAGAAIEAARQAVGRCIERAEGAAIVVGPAGTGKTLLCQVLAEQFHGRLEIAQLTSGRLCNRRALLQAILFELSLPYRGMDEGDLRLSLIDHLAPRSASPTTTTGEGLLLIVDEAHTLPLRLMEELRLITNLARHGQPRVRLVLVGGPQLEERFASPKLESFNQRIAVRGYLESLDRAQTTEYVLQQIEHVGGQGHSVFASDALDAIHRATDGIPRLINQVCDHALLMAYAGGVRLLPAAAIEEAWADLQQLPTPWSSSEGAAAIGGSADIIEFGSLDEDGSEDLPAAVPFPISARRHAAAGQGDEAEFENAVEFAAADDDFQPAGSIRPEVELTFQSLSTPFHTFDEEEVVLDRYTSIERDALANRPLVRGPESRALGAMLAPLTQQGLLSSSGASAYWPGGTPSSFPTIADGPTGEQLEDVRRDEIVSTVSPNETQHAAAPTSSSSAAVAPVGSHSSWVQTNDDDLIVIEEPAEHVAAAMNNPKPVARRQEYRQLFAQLRQR
jgi:type II secretory pathway predicted ATPase ExeA